MSMITNKNALGDKGTENLLNETCENERPNDLEEKEDGYIEIPVAKKPSHRY